MIALVNGRAYRVEFSYRRRSGKRPTLARNSPIEGLTACAIVLDGPLEYEDPPGLVAVAAALCSAGDNWSRREGRRQAFHRAVYECGPLRAEESAWLAWFRQRFPEPAKKAPRVKQTLTREEVERLEAEGRARKGLEPFVYPRVNRGSSV